MDPARPTGRATFGELLRQYRLAAGLTQEALAERAGLSVQGLSLLENGKRQAPYRSTMALLVRALGLSAHEGVTLEAAVVRARLPGGGCRIQSPAQAPRTNLPVQLTSFIGREQERTEVLRLLGGTRLLTLTGTGGVGKTRLALQVAAGLLDHYPQGVWLVELAPLADPALVPGAVLGVLGVPEQLGRPPGETLAEALRTWQLLLVLDNCEHLLDACARLSEALLRACVHVQVLATSREPLGLAGEARWRVRSLSLPAADQHPFPEVVAHSEAVQLFLERARAVQPAFALSAANVAAVAELCARLDGIPLALELAAVRLEALGVAELAALLDQRFRLLTGGSRTALPRQQTLQATAAWSYDLLTPREQLFFLRLSVFPGGWSLEAAEEVSAGGAITRDEVLDLIGGLVNKSLVMAEHQGDGRTRYRLMETLRQFGWQRLGAREDQDEVRQRHATYYRDRAMEAAQYLYGPDQVTWLDILECEHANLRAALAWAIERQDAALGLGLAASLHTFWYLRGRYSEGRTLLAAVLALPAGPELDAVRVEVLAGTGGLARTQGDYAAARAFLDEALAIARRAGDRGLLALTLTSLGFVARVQQDYGTARAALEEALTVAREGDDTLDAAIALHHLGLLTLEADGDCAAAWVLNEQSLVLFRQLGNHRMVANVLAGLARVARARGDAVEACALLAEALSAHRDSGDPMSVVVALHTLGATEAMAGRLARAVQVVTAATTMAESLGFRVWPALLRERDEWLGPARRALGEAGFAHAAAAGQAVTGEEALVDALAGLSVENGALLHPPPERRRVAPAPHRLSQTERLAWTLEHLRTVGALSPREYVAALGVKRRTAVRDLRALEARGLVVAQGATTDRRYALPPARP